MGSDYCPYNLKEILYTTETVNLKFSQSVAVVLLLILLFFVHVPFGRNNYILFCAAMIH